MHNAQYANLQCIDDAMLVLLMGAGVPGTAQKGAHWRGRCRRAMELSPAHGHVSSMLL